MLLRAVPPIRPVALDPVVSVELTTDHDAAVVRGYLEKKKVDLGAEAGEVELVNPTGEPVPVILQQSEPR